MVGAMENKTFKNEFLIRAQTALPQQIVERTKEFGLKSALIYNLFQCVLIAEHAFGLAWCLGYSV